MIFLRHYNYFKYLCTIHPDLLHEDVEGKSVFALATLEEALGNTRSINVEKGILFSLLEPTMRLTDNEGEQPRQTIEAGFIIAKCCNTRSVGSQDYLNAIDVCERIALDYATKIVADSQAGHPLFSYSINTLEELKWTASLVNNIGDGSYAGLLCLFEYNTSFNNCLDAHTSEAWKTQTPYNI
jgi:hypothetical protein